MCVCVQLLKTLSLLSFSLKSLAVKRRGQLIGLKSAASLCESYCKSVQQVSAHSGTRPLSLTTITYQLNCSSSTVTDWHQQLWWWPLVLLFLCTCVLLPLIICKLTHCSLHIIWPPPPSSPSPSSLPLCIGIPLPGWPIKSGG